MSVVEHIYSVSPAAAAAAAVHAADDSYGDMVEINCKFRWNRTEITPTSKAVHLVTDFTKDEIALYWNDLLELYISRVVPVPPGQHFGQLRLHSGNYVNIDPFVVNKFTFEVNLTVRDASVSNGLSSNSLVTVPESVSLGSTRSDNTIESEECETESSETPTGLIASFSADDIDEFSENAYRARLNDHVPYKAPELSRRYHSSEDIVLRSPKIPNPRNTPVTRNSADDLTSSYQRDVIPSSQRRQRSRTPSRERGVPEIYLDRTPKQLSSSELLDSTYDRLEKFVKRLEDREENQLYPRRNAFLDSRSSGFCSPTSEMTDLDSRNINLSKRYQDLVQRQLKKNNRSIEDLGLSFAKGAGDSVNSMHLDLDRFNRPYEQVPLDKQDYKWNSMPSLADSVLASPARKRFPVPKLSSSQQQTTGSPTSSRRYRPPAGARQLPPRSAMPYKPNGDYRHEQPSAAASGLVNGNGNSDQVEADILQLTRELNETKAENQSLQRQLSELKEKLPMDCDDPYGRLLAEKENLATEVYQLRQQLDGSRPRHEDSSSSIGHYDPDNPTALKRKIADLQGQLQDLQEAHESAAGKLGRAEHRIHQLEKSNEQMESVNGISVEDLQAENQYLRNQLEKLSDKRDNYYHDADARLSEEIAALRADMRTLRERNQQVNEDNIRLREEMRDVRVRSDERERRLRNFYNNKQSESSPKFTTDLSPVPLITSDKYSSLSPDRLTRHDDNGYGPLTSTQLPSSQHSYYGVSSKLSERHSFTSGDVHADEDEPRYASPSGHGRYSSKSALKRSRSHGHLAPTLTPQCRSLTRSSYELDNVSGSYYIDDLQKNERARSRSHSRSGATHRRSRGRSHGYDDDSSSSTSSILEEVERELGYLRSDSQGRSRSLDSRGSRRSRARSASPGDPALTHMGYRSVSPRPLITQHNKAALGFPTRQSLLSTSGKRPFAPRSPADIKQGDVVKFSRQNGKISKGLVKFVGHLPGRNDMYLGLELESEDGKHDGTYNGQRFFSCKHNKGVFVTFSKVVMVWG